MSAALERAALAIFNNRKQSGGAVRARGDARAGLEEALNVDEMTEVILTRWMQFAAAQTAQSPSEFARQFATDIRTSILGKP
jgi:hypothetical protein